MIGINKILKATICALVQGGYAVSITTVERNNNPTADEMTAESNGNPEQTDCYTLLGVAQNANIVDIRRSYRAALLKAHPDKHAREPGQEQPAPAVVIPQLQNAFRTLADPNLRAAYDQLLKEGKGQVTLTSVVQRPAHEVSLDEFESEEVAGRDGDMTSRWSYPCRCGGLFTIEERELEEGVHYIGCNGCSEVVWVGYEAVDDVQDQETESNPS